MRCARPTSARPGDRAIVLGDGTIEGFVGGSCADATVRLQALRVLETGEPVLLRILPGRGGRPGDEEGAVVVANPCLSGGALELFLEPHLPPPRVAVAGESPVARALVELARAASGFARAARRGGRAGRLRRGRRVARPRRRGRGAPRRSRRLRVRRARRVAASAARRCWTRCGRGRAPRRSSRACARPPASTSARGRTRRSRCRILAELVARDARGPSPAPRSSRPSRGGRPRVRMTVVVGPARRRRAAGVLLRGLPRRLARACRLSVRRGLVLAAGGSSRLGQPKQLLPYRGATLLDAVLGDRAGVRGSTSSSSRSAARRTRCARAVDLRGAEVVVNEAFGEGCSSSIAAAMRRARPALRRARAAARRPAGRDARTTVRALLAGRGDAPLAVCRVRRRPRPPVRVRRARCSASCARCTATRRCGSCSTGAPDDVVEVPVAGPVPLDVDTWDDYEAVLAAARREPPPVAAPRARRAVPTPARSRRGSTPSTTSPTRAWRPRCSSRCACPSRCCSRARRASARPRRRGRSPRRSARR